MRAEDISGPDGIPRRDFRDAMASLAATVCVVAAGTRETRLGRTVTSAFSLNAEPPSILVSIAAASPLAEMMRETGGFSFAALSERQGAIGDAFAGKVPPETRFEHGTWRTWSSGHPRLLGPVAAMDCTVLDAIEAQGHVLFVGLAREIALEDTCRPLVWHNRRYNSLQTW